MDVLQAKSTEIDIIWQYRFQTTISCICTVLKSIKSINITFHEALVMASGTLPIPVPLSMVIPEKFNGMWNKNVPELNGCLVDYAVNCLCLHRTHTISKSQTTPVEKTLNFLEIFQNI